MTENAIKIGGNKKSMFIDKVKEILPEGGNLNLCLTCGACSSGCPATGLEDMDPRKFLRMAALGMDEEILNSDWAWMCTLCMRCIYVCPMKIDIPQLVFNVRKSRPREAGHQPHAASFLCHPFTQSWCGPACSADAAGS